MFLTYEQYVEMGGTLAEADFGVLERRARGYINLVTHNRIAGETAEDGTVRKNVEYAMFDLIGLQQREDESAQAGADGIASMSNDGVSVSYADWRTAKAQRADRKNDVLVLYLADETVTIRKNGAEILLPILYGGVEYDGGSAALE